jgi:hypothetical protein|tara:strand:+ start:255 stop:1034 length:780 start_codon:yes stop_codon:yes gene_type:complete
MFLDIHLGNEANYKLTYELFDNRVAEKLWHRFQTLDLDFVSRTQFYNFGESEYDVQSKLTESITNIKRLLPDQFKDHADDLNSLHVNFPDLVKDTHGELRHWLSMFNYHLHHMEDLKANSNTRFLFSTQDDGEPLHTDDYTLFTPTKLNNHLYMNYPHVGKHVMEVWYDRDINIPADHIVPTSILKNDLLAWFANDQFTDADKTVKSIKRWCEQLHVPLPYSISDPKLAIGYIPLGKLTHAPDINAISRNKYIHSVEAR